MERYGYRDKARIISIVDMVWSTISLGQTFLGFLAVSAYSSWLNSVDPDQKKEWIRVDPPRDPSVPELSMRNTDAEVMYSPRALKRLAWAMVMAHFAIHFTQLSFAINLYTGTAKNNTGKAPSACRLWFIVSSLLLGILGLKLFIQAKETNVIFTMSEIIFRAVGMYIVGEYAKEVKNGAIYPPPPPVYFSTHPVSQPRIGHTLPIFMPAHHRDLPPKYEEVVRDPPVFAPVNVQSIVQLQPQQQQQLLQQQQQQLLQQQQQQQPGVQPTVPAEPIPPV